MNFKKTLTLLMVVAFLSAAMIRCQEPQTEEEENEEEDDEEESDEIGELIEDVDEFLHEVIDQREARDEKYNLTYFAWTGRAEILRWLLAYGGEEYDDIRVQPDAWTTLKPNTPFGQLPILDIERSNGEKYTLAQSKAIAIYLAERLDLDGETDTDEAFVNMYGEQLGDIFDAYNTALMANKTDSLLTTTWPTQMAIFEKRLVETNTGYLGGESLSWADIFLSQITDFLYDKKDTLLANYPNVKALDARVRSIPRIAKWISSRPANAYLWF